jgi:flagellar biosynthesis/type III secretory pathway M-ring protein FliF/YscJ
MFDFETSPYHWNTIWRGFAWIIWVIVSLGVAFIFSLIFLGYKIVQKELKKREKKDAERKNTDNKRIQSTTQVGEDPPNPHASLVDGAGSTIRRSQGWTRVKLAWRKRAISGSNV